MDQWKGRVKGSATTPHYGTGLPQEGPGSLCQARGIGGEDGQLCDLPAMGAVLPLRTAKTPPLDVDAVFWLILYPISLEFWSVPLWCQEMMVSGRAPQSFGRPIRASPLDQSMFYIERVF